MPNLFTALIDENKQTNQISEAALAAQILAIISKYTTAVDIDENTVVKSVCTDDQIVSILEECRQQFSLPDLDIAVDGTVAALVQAVAMASATTLVPTEQISDARWNVHGFNTIIKQAVSLRNCVHTAELESNESIVNGMFSMFITATNLFGRAGNLFKTNLFKFYKPLKRSELRAHVENNMGSMAQLKGIALTGIMDKPMYVPTGMLVSFPEAVTCLNDAHTAMHTLVMLEQFVGALDVVRRKMTRGDKSYLRGFNDVAIAITIASKNKSVAKLNAAFAGKGGGATTFTKAYGSVANLHEVTSGLLALEPRLNDTAKILSYLDNTDVMLGDITAYLSEDSEVDPKFVASLATIVEHYANLYDAYGAAVLRQMTMEHNHVLNLITATTTMRGSK